MSQDLPGRRSAGIALWIGLASPLCASSGAALASYEIATPLVGFRIFALALPLGVLGILAAMVALFNTRKDRNPAGRRMGIASAMACVLTIAMLVGLTLPTATLPLINDITTDLADPPEFTYAATMSADPRRDLGYPKEFAARQRQGYPTLTSLRLDVAPEEALERARTALAALRGTRITHVDTDGGVIEAVSVSRVFRFVDDLVVRVRSDGSGSVVDVRSKSRDGKGDLGANAARIEALFLLLR